MKRFQDVMSGVCLCLAALSLCQDAFGLENFLVYVRENWVSSFWSGPIAVGVIALCVYNLARG